MEKNPGPEDREVRGRPPVMVTSYNVRGLNGNSKLRHLVNHLYKINKGKDVDFIACLQETYLMNPKSLTYLWRGNLFLTPGNGNSCGCITFLSSHLNVIASRNIENRAHVIVCQRTGETNAAYIIANIYAPNPNVNSKIEFFEQVFDTVNEFEESFGCENSMILGDFNLVFNEREIKNRNHSPQERRVASAVKLLIDSNNLSDIWESKASFTWNRANSDIFSTIDRILYKKANLETRNINVNWAVSNSDHAAVEASFAFTCKPMKSRSRIVRIDPYLAKDPTLSRKLIEGFNEMISTMPNGWDPHNKLEFAKVSIRSVAERIQAESKRDALTEEQTINEDLNDTMDALAKVTISGARREQLIEQVEELRARKAVLIERKGERLAEKLGTKWYNEGEKSTKYFLRLLKRPNPDDFVEIEGENGEKIKDPDGIKNEIESFYKKLYQDFERLDANVDDDFFNEIQPISGLGEDAIVKPVTIEELRETLHSCSDSAPGPDGIPYSILGLLWSTLGPILLEAWNHSLVTGKLAPSHRISYLKLIPKLGKDLAKLTNWRPITLSNCDHKLITKTYANRMCTNVANNISGCQTAYLSSRLINDNIRSLISTVNLTNIEERAKGLLVALDAKKAFDSVDHGYIESCLKSFGCERFIKIFRTLYSDLRTKIIVNGEITEGYLITRGVKQGDALSCIIFIMCMEPLLRNIEANVQIEPLHSTTLNNQLPKCYAYADDVNVAIKETANGLQALFNEYERLSRMSNLELNADKTELLLLGNRVQERTLNVSYLNRNYSISSKPKLKINGIVFQRDIQCMKDDNVAEVIKKMDKMFKQWSRRSLTLLGKILIVKTFGVSQAIYLMQSMSLNSTHFKKLNAILYKFIWNRHYLAAKAPERIKREIINTPVKLGGFGMLDIVALDESLKIKALGRLLVTNHPFLTLVRARTNFGTFFHPVDNAKIEEVTGQGIALLSKDREELWEDPSLDRHVQFLNLVADTDLKSIVSGAGLRSIPFYLMWRRGCRKIRDLRQQDLITLNRYIDRGKIKKIELAIANRSGNAAASLLTEYLYKGISKPIDKLAAKFIRESRTKTQPVNSLKLGTILTSVESKSWGLKLTKLSSTRHKNILLRVAHGDIYTKAKLTRFGLSNDSSCPRCGEIEDLNHKFVTCDYVKRIWEEALRSTRSLTTFNPRMEAPEDVILGCYRGSNLTTVTLNAELLQRIHLLKDDTNFLIHPKHFVKQAILFLIRREKNSQIKENLNFIL